MMADRFNPNLSVVYTRTQKEKGKNICICKGGPRIEHRTIKEGGERKNHSKESPQLLHLYINPHPLLSHF